MPTIGTGVLMYPPNEWATAMSKGFSEYLKKLKDKEYPEKISIVWFGEDIVSF